LELDISALAKLSESAGGGLGQTTYQELNKVPARLALRPLISAILHSPGYADAYAYLGQALDLLGWSDLAQAALQLALQRAPQSAIVQTLTGLYWDRHKSPALARQYYEAAFKQDPDNVALCLEIASTYAVENQYTAAEVWLLFAVEIAPDDARVWKMLSSFYLASGIDAKESGLWAATRLLELAPDDAYAHDLMGWAQFLSQEDTPARESLTKALLHDPTLASAHYHLGRLNARQNRYVEAAAAYRRAADYDVDGQLMALLERAWDDLPLAFQDEH
jgi:tetratricopeptide (TPR) repeat protein